MAANPNTNFTAGQILTADQANRWPRGAMGYAISSGNFSIGTGEADITGMSITFTAVANRLYKATFFGYYSQNTAGATVSFRLTDAANTSQNVISQVGETNGGNYGIGMSYLFTVAAGSTTRKMRAVTTSGTGSIFGDGGDGRRFSFTIEDIGPA